jgi:tetratricopeptide (TPR) repeat protein
MNHDVYIETILDEFVKSRLTRKKAEVMLTSVEVANPSDVIELHFAAAKALQRYNILTQVQNIHKDYAKANITKITETTANTAKVRALGKKPLIWMMGVAASLVIIIGSWFTYQYATTSSNGLYSEIYQPYNVNTDRSITEINTHSMVEDFKEKNYTAVIKIFSTLAASNNREKFLTAYAYHENNEYKNSLSLLLQIIEYNKQNNTKLYNDEAEFYAGLCYLKLKDYKAALPSLEAIRKNPNHTFNERVSKWTITRIKWLN